MPSPVPSCMRCWSVSVIESRSGKDRMRRCFRSSPRAQSISWPRAWLPEGHAAYWSRYGAAAEEVGRFYDGARFFWAVPDYIPESEVASIGDLTKPSVAARMTKLIQGIGTGASVTTLSQKAGDDYALSGAGDSLRPGK